MISIPMTDAQFDAASVRLRAGGIDLASSSGTLTKDGITATYSHANGTLTIEITDKPMLLPLALIEGTLRAYIEKSIEGATA